MAKDIFNEIFSSLKRNHYELLGLKFFENDQEKIQAASLSQMKKLKAWDLHQDEETSEQIKEMHIQLSRAIGELQDPGKKQEYDKVLAFELGIEVPYLNNASELELLNKVDTIQILTKLCPECGEIVLDKDVLCIQCGYNFVTRTILETNLNEPFLKEEVVFEEVQKTQVIGRASAFFLKFTTMVVFTIVLFWIIYKYFTVREKIFNLKDLSNDAEIWWGTVVFLWFLCAVGISKFLSK